MVNAMNPQSVLYPIAIAAVALLGACHRSEVQSTQTPQDPPMQVRTTQLSPGPITRSVILPAQVIAFQEATLYAKVSGYLKSIAVDKGDKVAAGAGVARIEKPELLASTAETQAGRKLAPAGFSDLHQTVATRT